MIIYGWWIPYLATYNRISHLRQNGCYAVANYHVHYIFNKMSFIKQWTDDVFVFRTSIQLLTHLGGSFGVQQTKHIKQNQYPCLQGLTVAGYSSWWVKIGNHDIPACASIWYGSTHNGGLMGLGTLTERSSLLFSIRKRVCFAML